MFNNIFSILVYNLYDVKYVYEYDTVINNDEIIYKYKYKVNLKLK
jgi:hypothetical protein